MEENEFEKEIEYWSKHLELDKFNYGAELSSFIGSLSIAVSVMIGLIAMTMTYKGVNSITKLIAILIIGLGFLYFLKYKLIKSHHKNLNQHKLHFFIRERMLQERYENLYGISKDELNTEFNDLKQIALNKKDSLREHSFKEYYKNKRRSKKS